MNGSTENRAHGASEKPGRRETTLNLPTSRSMLPLVERIVGDILSAQKSLEQLLPQQNQLERHRRELSWPERSRRYRLQDEIAGTEKHLQDALAELATLGLQLLDGEIGRVGFPTIVNGRRAFFSWQPGDDGIQFWQFPEESTRRPVPATWNKSAEPGLAKKN